nr:immunoglobulin light chain junction region [Macaca mulatta]
CQHGYDAPFIF